MMASFFFPAKRAPFQLRFVTDGFEFVNELPNPDNGFQLAYILSNTGC